MATSPQPGRGAVDRAIGRSSAGLMGVHSLAYLLRLLKVPVIAAFFGTAGVIECYYAALNLPTVIIGVLNGALVTAVIPLLVESRTRDGETAAARLWTHFGLRVGAVLILLFVVLGVFAEPVVRLVTDPEVHDTALTAWLFRLLLGYFALHFVFQYLSLLFQTHGNFVYPWLSSIPNLAVNLVVIVVLLWGPMAGLPHDRQVVSLIWGLFAGVLLHNTLMIGRGRSQGFLRVDLGPPPPLRRAARNTVGLLLSGLLSPATLVTVDIIMAATVDRGIATLQYAYAIFMFPINVGVMNVGYVLLPHLSQQVVDRDWAALGRTVSLTTRVLIYVSVPVAVGLWLVSPPLIETVLERGAFTSDDTSAVAATLRAYSWSLLFAGLATVATKLFNAMQRVRVILWTSAVAFAVKIALNAVLRERMGVEGIAYATAAFYAVNFLLLAWAFHRAAPVKLEWQIVPSALLALAGGGVMAGAVLGVSAVVALPAPALLAVQVAVGAAVWVGWSAALRLPEFTAVWRMVRGRGRGAVPQI